MSIDLSSITEIRDKIGVVTKITDASGRVLWSTTIKFTINGDTYVADRDMTWAEWFASEYNTTGETEGTVKDSSGNEIDLSAVIVSGAVYEVGFGPPMATVALRCGAYASEYVDYAYITVPNASGTDSTIRSDLQGWQAVGTIVSGAVIGELPVGTVITCYVKSKNDYVSAYVKVNGTKVLNRSSSSRYGTYAYTVTGNATITLTTKPDKYGYIEITET